MQALIQYPGGKARLASRIVSLFFSYHRKRTAFLLICSAAGRISPWPYLTDPICLKFTTTWVPSWVNFFRVMRDPALREHLIEMLTWTPYSRRQFKECLKMPVPDDPVERAWRFFTIIEQSFASKTPSTVTPGNWAYSGAETNKPHTWVKSVDSLHWFGQRLRQVHTENLDYRDLIVRYDGPDVLICVDPPYLVRHCSDNLYISEMKSVEEHRELAEVLNSIKGMAVLSGYDSLEYQEWYDRQGGERHEFDVVCSMAGATLNRKGRPRPRRTECVWLNPACVRDRVKARPVQLSLFDLGVL